MVSQNSLSSNLSSNLDPLAILIGGPTASGKTHLAFELARKFPSVVVNADSMQIYNELQILTNQPSCEERKKIDCELFGYMNYPESCNVALWGKHVKQVLLNNKHKVPIFVGGSGMYLNSIINEVSEIPNINPRVRKSVRQIQKKYGNNFLFEKLKTKSSQYINKLQVNDTQRIIRAMEVQISTGKPIFEWYKKRKNHKFKRILYVVLTLERSELYRRINKRCEKMIELGIINEIEKFLSKNEIKKNHPLHKAIGLNIFRKYILLKTNFDSSMNEFKKDTRRYAKRQITWFKNKSDIAKQLDYSEAKNYILNNLNKN